MRLLSRNPSYRCLCWFLTVIQPVAVPVIIWLCKHLGEPMEIATMQCHNGHTWHTIVTCDEPDVNATEVEEPTCPTCGSDHTMIILVEPDDPD